MIKGRVVPPKCLFHVVTQTEKDQYTLTEQSAHLLLLKIGTYKHHTAQSSYSYP